MTSRCLPLRILAALAVALPSGALAGTADGWTQAGKRAGGTVFVDRSSLQAEPQHVRFVARVDLAEAARLNRNGREFRSVVVEARARCAAQQIATTRTAFYDLPGARGDKVAEFAPPVEARHYAPVPPAGSPERVMFEYVCAASPRP